MRLAQPVHLPLLVALPGGELAPERLSESVPVRPREQGARVEQLVEHDRMPVEILRRPARRAQQLREARERRGVLLEQGEIRGAAADRFHEFEAAYEGR